MLYGARQTTKDVDAYFVRPAAAVVRSAASRVAGTLELPEDWLNDGAKAYLVQVTEGPVLYESEFLLVRAPSIAQLLAMKLAAWRDDIDRKDARRLLSKLHGTFEELRAQIEPLVLPAQRDKASYAFEAQTRCFGGICSRCLTFWMFASVVHPGQTSDLLGLERAARR